VLQNATLASDSSSDVPISTDPVYVPSSGEEDTSTGTAGTEVEPEADAGAVSGDTYIPSDAGQASGDEDPSSSSALVREPVYFGQSLAISHNLLYVGAPGWALSSGRVFVYSLGLASGGDAVMATLHASIVPFDSAPNAMFGTSIIALYICIYLCIFISHYLHMIFYVSCG
jgi:hypothetical protein